MKINNVVFKTSVNKGALLNQAPEIAVVGRSNVGKSSFINYICGNGKLARTSSTPGRTRLINYFEVNSGEFFIVDLPGYGFAKVSKEEKEGWGEIIEGYFQNSETLKHVFIITDIRIPDSPKDIQMINYCYHYNIPFTIIANKSDKVAKSKIPHYLKLLAAGLKVAVGNIIAVSCLDKKGKDVVFERIDQILHTDNKFE